MQNPMTPTRPEQSSLASSQRRELSMSSYGPGQAERVLDHHDPRAGAGLGRDGGRRYTMARSSPTSPSAAASADG